MSILTHCAGPLLLVRPVQQPYPLILKHSITPFLFGKWLHFSMNGLLIMGMLLTLTLSPTIRHAKLSKVFPWFLYILEKRRKINFLVCWLECYKPGYFCNYVFLSIEKNYQKRMRLIQTEEELGNKKEEAWSNWNSECGSHAWCQRGLHHSEYNLYKFF